MKKNPNGYIPDEGKDKDLIISSNARIMGLVGKGLFNESHSGIINASKVLNERATWSVGSVGSMYLKVHEGKYASLGSMTSRDIYEYCRMYYNGNTPDFGCCPRMLTSFLIDNGFANEAYRIFPDDPSFKRQIKACVYHCDGAFLGLTSALFGSGTVYVSKNGDNHFVYVCGYDNKGVTVANSCVNKMGKKAFWNIDWHTLRRTAEDIWVMVLNS